MCSAFARASTFTPSMPEAARVCNPAPIQSSLVSCKASSTRTYGFVCLSTKRIAHLDARCQEQMVSTAERRSLEPPEADESARSHDKIGDLWGARFLNTALAAEQVLQAVDLVQFGDAGPEDEFVCAYILEGFDDGTHGLGCGGDAAGYLLRGGSHEGVGVEEARGYFVGCIRAEAEIGAGYQARLARATSCLPGLFRHFEELGDLLGGATTGDIAMVEVSDALDARL